MLQSAHIRCQSYVLIHPCIEEGLGSKTSIMALSIVSLCHLISTDLSKNEDNKYMPSTETVSKQLVHQLASTPTPSAVQHCAEKLQIDLIWHCPCSVKSLL